MIYNIPIDGRIYQINVSTHKESLRLTFPYNQQLISWIKDLDEAKWEPDLKFWSIKASNRNLYCLQQLENNYDPTYDSPVPVINPNRSCLRENQKSDLNFAIHRKRCILAAEMGLGKTLVGFEVMEKIGGKWWVILGQKTAGITWNIEKSVWNSKANFITVTPNKLANLLLKEKAELEYPDHVWVDEAHVFKNPTAQRTQAAFLLSEIVKGYFILATGTVEPKDPTDQWALVELCKPGYLRESSKKKLYFKLALTEKTAEGYHKFLAWRTDQVKHLNKRLGGIIKHTFKKDCKDIPPILYKPVILDYTDKDRRIVNATVNIRGSGVTTIARLRQVSDGYDPNSLCEYCWGQGCNKCINGESPKELPTPKDEALQDYLEQDRNRLVIFAAFHRSIDKIERLAKEAGWLTIKLDGRGLKSELEEPIKLFGSDYGGKICYIGHPKSGGVSVNLQKSDTAIFYSNDFDAAARPQAEGRINRIGSVSSTIVDLLWLPTDHYTLLNLKRKIDLHQVSSGQIEELTMSWDPIKFYQANGDLFR